MRCVHRLIQRAYPQSVVFAMALLGLLVASVVDHHSSADPVLKAAPPPTVKETKTALPLERAAGAAGGDFSAVADPTANLRELARGGANALYALATLSETGKGVALDPRAAYDLYERAAEIGHPAALYRLAIIHGDRGTDADRIRATEYLTRAARLGYAPAQRELLRLQDQQSTTGEPTVPSYAIARAARGHLAGLETADQAARLAHLQLRSAFTAGSVSDLRAAWAASFTAETQLDNLRYAAWTNIVMTERTPVLLSEALQLAFLDLQVEVRRRVGPLAHTVVPGLETAPGCAGDIVAERLVATYGRQVSTLVADVSNVADEARLLQRLAFQMACLGERQMILLEWGLGSGFVDVEGRMRSNGLGRLIPAFARLMAPLQVLVMDTQKHRGSRSFAYQWFALYQPELQTAIAQGGWASKGGLSIWNRQSAGLLIVPNCQEGQRSPNCVDTLAFLRSLADPRSLGFGDCALSGMITAGLIEGEQGGSRYTCPSLGCDTNGAPRSDDANLQWTRDRLTEEQGPWPDDRGTTVLPDNQSLCRSPSDQDFQGAGGNMDACLDPLGESPVNPWDTYVSCVAEGLGDGGNAIPFGQLAGIPTGRRCSAFASGPGSPLPGTSAHTAGRVRNDIFGGHRPEQPSAGDAGTGNTSPSDASMPNLPELKGTETSGTAPTRDQLNDKLKQDIQRQIADPAALKTKEDIDRLQGDVERAVQEGAMSPEEGQATLEGLQTLREGAQDCLDIGGCVNDCSGLGAQVARINGCTDQLLDSFSEAIGRPRSRPSGDRKPLDWVSYPVPDDAGSHVGVGESPSCMSDTGANSQPAACGLMLCTDSTLASVEPGELKACSCRQSVGPVHLTARLCQALDCGPDAEQMDDCSCRPLDGGEVTPPSGPGPLDNILFRSDRSLPR